MAERKKTQDDNAASVDGVALVKMARHGGNPNEANVHPDEVANYQAGGWFVVAPVSVEAE